MAIEADTDAGEVMEVGVGRGLSLWGHPAVSMRLFRGASPLVEDATMRGATPGERDTTFCEVW